MDADLKIAKAKTKLILDHPFFGAVCAGMKFKEDKKSKGMWTNGKQTGYNPFYLDQISFDETVGLVAHIVLHRALLHHKRLKDKDPGLWNSACDYSINWILIESGFELPEGYLFREDLKNLSAEKIYGILISEKDEKEEQRGETSNDEGSNNESESDDEEGFGERNDSDSSEEETEENEVESDSDETSEDVDGSGEDGEEDKSDQNNSQEFTGEVRQPESMDPDDNSGDGEFDEEPDYLLAQAFNKSLNEGSLPGSLQRMIEEVLRPKLDWRKLLAKFVSMTGKSDYTWVSPNKRYIHSGFYLPGMKNENLESIIIAIDTSGSISQAELIEFTAEVSSVLGVFNGEIVVLGCDTSVNFAERYSSADLPDKFEFKGGGGTDFRPPFEWAEDNSPNTRCLIYFTDLCSSRYPTEPNYPVLWVTNNEKYPKGPPFGEIININ